MDGNIGKSMTNLGVGPAFPRETLAWSRLYSQHALRHDQYIASAQ